MSSCRKCLTSRTGDKIGDKCRTQGCDGIIEEEIPFKDLVKELPEPMTCGRRADNGMDKEGGPFVGAGPNLDRWQKFKSNGNRVCSFCGSLHPDDFLALCKAASEAPEDAPYKSTVQIEPSDKKYKIYVHQPGVRNAHEGGIKFYTHHLPWSPEGKSLVTKEQEGWYVEAVKKSQARFNLMLAKGRAIRDVGIEPGTDL